MVNSLPLNLHRIQALPNSLKNDLFRKEQLIDGILALSKSFSIKITNDIWIKRENVHDLSAKFGKSTFLSKTTAKQPLVLPAIYIAQQHGYFFLPYSNP
uniref:Uncharacterized protein n=1 Tax=Romanomermis culicivorax TaxID=13658 RepID=A0A915K1E3_ROMCU